MATKKTTFTELIVKGLMLFSIFTVIQSFPALDSINRIWLAVVSVALVFKLMGYKYTVIQFWVLFITAVIHGIAIYFTEFPLVHVNMLFYFLIWVLLYMFFAKSKKAIMGILNKSDNYINLILCVWTAVVGISACLPSGYRENYFVSFAGNSFRFMMAVLIITAVAMYMAISRGNKRYNFFLIIPTYAAFMNESRTYFGVYLLFLMMYIYMEFKSKKVFYSLLIPMVLLVCLLTSISGIMDKFIARMYTERSYFDFWGTVTGGRTVFWKWDLDAFWGLPFWQQFVGNGFNFVFDVNRENMSEIWAHNDIINLLMNFGYIGVWIYCWIFLQMINTFGFRERQIPRVVKFLFLGAVFLNSMMNMSYTYVCAMISYPFFLCTIHSKYYKD